MICTSFVAITRDRGGIARRRSPWRFHDFMSIDLAEWPLKKTTAVAVVVADVFVLMPLLILLLHCHGQSRSGIEAIARERLVPARVCCCTIDWTGRE